MEPNIKPYLSTLAPIREQLHRRPEEGWTEFETTWLITNYLRKLGLSVKVGLANILPSAVMGRNEATVEQAQQRALLNGVPVEFLGELSGYTGAVTEIKTGRPGPITALRFDMDCVPITETVDPSHIPNCRGFASERPGLMHACGHDTHTSVGLAVAKWLTDHKDELSGTIRLIYQPAEEGARGAAAMAAKGIVDDVDNFIGAHIGSRAKLGELLIATGGLFASSKIDVSFTGEAAHAGADPEKGRNALLAACDAALLIAAIPRHSAGESRVNVGQIHGGEGRNSIPAHAELMVETRGITCEVNDFIENKVRAITNGIAQAYDVTPNVTLKGKALTIAVSPDLIETALAVAKTIPGIQKVATENRPTASEDCTVFMHRVVDHGGRALFFYYGANHQGHHRSNFDIQNEAMSYGLEMFIRMLLKLNGRLN